MMRSTFFGIDPGQSSGGLAWIDPSRFPQVVETTAMPETERDIADWIKNRCYQPDYGASYAVIERVQAMPIKGRKQGAVGMFRFGQNYGFLRGVLVATGIITFEEIRPRVWQQALGIVPRQKLESDSEWKNRLKSLAQQLFPSLKVTLKTADALLIAEYCRRKHKGTL
jgi:hypothetical protein